MDLAALQSGGSHRLSSPASQQVLLAGPAPSVRSGLDSGQPVSGLPGKAISQPGVQLTGPVAVSQIVADPRLRGPARPDRAGSVTRMD